MHAHYTHRRAHADIEHRIDAASAHRDKSHRYMGLRRPCLDARYAKYLDRLNTGVSFQETRKPLEPCKIRLFLRSNTEDFIQLPSNGLPIALFHGIAQWALRME